MPRCARARAWRRRRSCRSHASRSCSASRSILEPASRRRHRHRAVLDRVIAGAVDLRRLPDRARRDRAPDIRCRRASAPRCRCRSVSILFQLIPGLQRSSGYQLSSPITSCDAPGLRRDRIGERRRGNRPCSPPRSTAAHRRALRARRRARARLPAAPRRRPPRSGWSSPGRVANAVAVVNILVFEAGMKRWSGLTATISLPVIVIDDQPEARPRRRLGQHRLDLALERRILRRDRPARRDRQRRGRQHARIVAHASARDR